MWQIVQDECDRHVPRKWIMEILRILDKKQKEASLSAQKIHESSLTAGQKTIS
eukprot:m.184765 g.184765  ORF g.184765 m.184765 type:complete len:53 (+) comp39333_c0_seq10:631-789(+)